MQFASRLFLALPGGPVWVTPLLMAIGALFGMAGTWLLYIDRSAVDQVFALYLISNCAWTTAAIRSRQFWLLVMNANYLVISLLGVLNPT